MMLPRPGPRSVSCAWCCVPFASTGVAFLFLAGSLIKSQPVFVTGIENPGPASRSCFGAAYMYLAVIVVSVAVILYEKKETVYRGPQYGAINNDDL